MMNAIKWCSIVLQTEGIDADVFFNIKHLFVVFCQVGILALAKTRLLPWQ